MAVYKIYKEDEEINRIVADEKFVTEYCNINGYTYELEPEQDPEKEPEDQEEYEIWAELDKAYQEGVDSV